MRACVLDEGDGNGDCGVELVSPPPAPFFFFFLLFFPSSFSLSLLLLLRIRGFVEQIPVDHFHNSDLCNVCRECP